MILFLFLCHLGVGVALTLPLVSRRAGVKFFRFNAGLAAALLVAALAFQPRWPDIPRGHPWLPPAATALPWACLACLAGYWLIVGRILPALRAVLLWAGLAAGVGALGVQAAALTWDRPVTMQALAVLSFLSSAMFLGAASSSMVLGHWYLVIPSLEVSHLQSIVKVHIGSIVVRSAVVAAAVMLGLETWQPGLGGDFGGYILSSRGIFFWQRVLFGLVGPAVLAYLTWETAKIRSTQSATGILYVDFFTVIVGELLAKYLLLETSVPV